MSPLQREKEWPDLCHINTPPNVFAAPLRDMFARRDFFFFFFVDGDVYLRQRGSCFIYKAAQDAMNLF